MVFTNTLFYICLFIAANDLAFKRCILWDIFDLERDASC